MSAESQYIPPQQEAQLGDIMAAMDVVDTLRHEQISVTRELDEQGRRQRLLLRLQDMYAAQGIDVPEHVLLEGIRALEEERFKYRTIEPSWRTRLARMWVSRARWGKPVGFLGVLASLLSSVYVATDVYPAWQNQRALPDLLTSTTNAIIALSEDEALTARSLAHQSRAQESLDREDYQQASELIAELETTRVQLNQEYAVRIVSVPGKASGVWRLPPSGQGRNYYLIVEAVDQRGKLLTLPIANEEDNSVSQVDKWGLRVNQATFERVARDKRDDGIIQANIVGQKRRGYMAVDYAVATSGGTITAW